ncbi:MAG: dockerin type I repeat-containing protein [Clostridia bacterium]|nr:dockerin type I repeat-containing protein [Clostridia bacterium]
MRKLLKSALSLIMATLLISAMAIMPASAQSEDDVISSLSITGSYIPEVGMPLNIPSLEIDDPRCYVVEGSVEWRYSEDAIEWDSCSDAIHAYDFSYGLLFKIETLGSFFADEVEVTVDGYLANFVPENSTSAYVAVEYDGQALETIVAENVPVPAIGKPTTLEDMFFLGNGTDDVFDIIEAMLLEKDAAGEYIESSDTEFVEGKDYSYMVFLSYNGYYGYTGFAYGTNPEVETNYGSVESVYNGIENLEIIINLGEATEEYVPDTDTSSDDTNTDDTNSDDTNTDDTNTDDTNSDDTSSDDTNSDDTNTDDTNSDDTNTDDTNTDDIPEKPLYGDVNCDDVVNMEDVTALQKIIAELNTHNDYGEMSKINSDCNHDDVITMEDVTTIQKFLAKLIDSLDLKV